MNIYLSIGIILIVVIAAVVTVMLYRRSTTAILKRSIKLVDDAIMGKELKVKYDESMESALVKKISRYIDITNQEKEKVKSEKDAVKSLVSDIAHQTKTPLSNILLLTQLVKEDEKIPKESMKTIDQIYDQSEKLGFLIESLVKSSYLESGLITVTPERQNISPLIQIACDDLKLAAAEKNINIFFAPEETICSFDEKWTKEVFVNILDNAIKYSTEGTEIYIRTEQLAMFTRIDIRDQGIGIDESEQAQIFTRFYRSPSVLKEDGLGIGLYLARKILALEKGYIKVKSTPKNGSTFSVYIPNSKMQTSFLYSKTAS